MLRGELPSKQTTTDMVNVMISKNILVRVIRDPGIEVMVEESKYIIYRDTIILFKVIGGSSLSVVHENI